MSESPHSDDCPYCGQEMEPGELLGERVALKWKPAARPAATGKFWWWLFGGELVGDKTFWGPRCVGWRCRRCGKIIVEDHVTPQDPDALA